MSYRGRHSRRRTPFLLVVASVLVVAFVAGGLWLLRASLTPGTTLSLPQRTGSPAVTGTPSGSVSASAAFATPGGSPSDAPSSEPPRPPSDTLRMVLMQTIGGPISPKSVAASGTGLVFAQNMMYNNTITVYDAWGHLEKTISDAVRLSDFGFTQYPNVVRGSPVEAAFSPDRKYVYVSNYSMYGPGFPSPGHDSCSPADGHDRSFLFRVNVATLKIDDVIQVGSVPKVVATTPDGKYVLNSNWCSYDLSISSTKTDKEIERIPIGPYPRGIVVDAASRFAYVAVMGSTRIARIDLRTFEVSWLENIGSGPRALVLSPDGRYLYATLNSSYAVAKVDLRTGQVVGRTSVGVEPRSMVIAPDGGSLYLVNYGADTAMKIRTKDMALLQTVQTGTDPIGITYEPTRNRIWVSNYTGSIMIFNDVEPPAGAP